MPWLVYGTWMSWFVSEHFQDLSEFESEVLSKFNRKWPDHVTLFSWFSHICIVAMSY